MTPLTTHPQISFAQLGVRDEIVRALAEQGIEHAFAIQELTLPLALSGDDLIGQARTGMGKTFAFGVPLLHRITTDTTRPLNGTPRALVVVPTRELCLQVFGDLEGAAKYLQAEGDRPLSVVSIYGGRPYEPQIESLRKGADVVVGTPGRLLDLAQQGHLQLGGLSVLVLDEADEMLDLGFLPDIERILRQIPDERQAMLFSATMPDPIITLARTFMNQPTHIRAEGVQGAATHDTTEQFVYRAHALDKVEMVSRILQAEGRGATMIFTRTKRTAQKVADELAERGFKVGAVHGDLGQIAREKALKAFRAGDVDVLVATDVAARGLDVERISHVVNFDIPHDPESYVHRIGRTGRAGRSGTALLFVTPRERHLLNSIERVTRQKLVEGQLPSVEDVNAQRVEKFRDSITDALNAPGFEMFRRLIEDYERDNDVPMADIAAALALQSRDGAEFLMTEPPPEKKRERPERPERERAPRKTRDDLATYRIAVGKKHKVGPGSIVGAIANEGGLHRSDFGHITIKSDFSLVELPAKLSKQTLKALEKTRISGVLIDLKPDRGRASYDARPSGGKPRRQER